MPLAPSLEELLTQMDVEEEMTQRASSSPASVSPFNIKNFEAFLVKSHCDENYQFWKACNYYLERSEAAGFDFAQWNNTMYASFIQANAPMECNLPHTIKRAYKDWHDRGAVPKRDVVLEARQHALNLMADAYRQFVRYTTHATPPPPSPALGPQSGPAHSGPQSGPSTTYFPQQRDLKRRKNSHERRPSDLKLHRSITECTASKSTSRVSVSMDSTSSSQSDLSESLRAGASTNRLINKGKALVTKLKKKTKRPTLKSSSSANNGVPY